MYAINNLFKAKICISKHFHCIMIMPYRKYIDYKCSEDRNNLFLQSFIRFQSTFTRKSLKYLYGLNNSHLFDKVMFESIYLDVSLFSRIKS